jgi:predicted dehydrogenase
MNKLNRRTFLKSSILTGASVGLLPALGADDAAPAASSAASKARVAGANDAIRFAVVGFNDRGKSHLGGLRAVEGCRLVALCDVDSKVLAREVENAKKKHEDVIGYTDVRKLLENKDIDVVTFATPNHWHSLGSIWAVQAGKDVYVEKPISHNVWEGRKVVEAARAHNRIVQAGTQSRSSSGIREGIAWLKEGHLGKILRARGFCYKRRPSIGKVDGPQEVPSNIDYDIWCGPAPKEPLMRKRLHYDWHWVWPSGNGDLGNQGIHQMDISRWFLGESELSPRILSVGGRLGYVDDGTTPNTLIVYHDYKAAPLIFEVRGLPESSGSDKMDKYHGASVGVVIDCEGGSVLIPDYTEAIMRDKNEKEIKRFKGTSSHFANFVDAVRSRKHTDLNADILEGHLSSALCHTGNISYRLGKSQSSAQCHEEIKSNNILEEAFSRMQEHLSANQVDISKTPVTLGVGLEMDPKREKFIGNAAADKYLTREYREPFVVREKV